MFYLLSPDVLSDAGELRCHHRVQDLRSLIIGL